MSEQKPSRRSFVSFAILLTVVAVVGFAIINRQTIYDYIAAWQYRPESTVSSIEKKLELTSLGSLYFNASLTKLQTAKDFNQDCSQKTETNNPILGCYVNNRIYIYDVTNDELSGVEETTAAHELLHAAYQRLSDGDRKALDEEIEMAYEKVKTPELERRMAYYDKTEPGEKFNELHSILGSEFHDLGSVLEAHYAKYFRSRKVIVNFFDQYSSVFRSVTTRLSELADSINQQTAAVNADIASYNEAFARLNNDIETFNKKSDSSGFGSQAEFNAQRAELESSQTELSSKRATIEKTIASIEVSRKKYDKLVDRYNELNNSINSSLAPTPAL